MDLLEIQSRPKANGIHCSYKKFMNHMSGGNSRAAKQNFFIKIIILCSLKCFRNNLWVEN